MLFQIELGLLGRTGFKWDPATCPEACQQVSIPTGSFGNPDPYSLEPSFDHDITCQCHCPSGGYSAHRKLLESSKATLVMGRYSSYRSMDM